jgi:hypothetical protein
MVMLRDTQEQTSGEIRLGKFSGGCHCGYIKVQLIARNGAGSIPKARSCGFCTKLDALMLSVPDGLMILELSVRPVAGGQRSGITEFHICPSCGLFIAATWSDEDRLLGAVNLHAIERSEFLDQPVPLDFDHEPFGDTRTGRRLPWMPAHIASRLTIPRPRPAIPTLKW